MKIRSFALLLVLTLAVACEREELEVPKNGVLPANEQMEPAGMDPGTRSETLEDMLVSIGRPAGIYSNPDDWEFLMILFCNDLEGADALIADSPYNWFSVCGDLSNRNPDNRNAFIRLRAPYNMINSVNSFLAGFDEDTTDPSAINRMAQARALRAWSYMLLANEFQFSYLTAADKPAVAIVTLENTDYSSYPRSSLEEVYELIIEDLDYAVDHLEGSERVSKMYIDGNVAHGLRARAFLEMGEWQKALDDATKAMQGYSPATLEEVSKPAFYDISEHNWIWGYEMNTDLAMNYRYATTTSWLRSFSAWSYAATTQCYTCINKLLYDKIPDTDIRKQWWVDENLESTLLDGLKWPGFDDVAWANDGGDAKLPYLPYTNVKFGCYTVGTTSDDEDMPLMRVEEMILIRAECLARLGNNSEAISTLEQFVNTYRYREGSYNVSSGGRSILDEIWFQRRIELWGEGFFMSDMKRLNKPLVRFHDDKGNIAPIFRFNLPSDDPWLLLCYPENEPGGGVMLSQPTPGGDHPETDLNPTLRDGVTD